MQKISFSFPKVTTQLELPTSRASFFRALAKYSNSPVLCDRALKKYLPAKLQSRAIFVPSGEAAKDWRILENILSKLALRQLDRHTPLIVLGGGATCDLGALAASLYRRGIPLVLAPTTLLAQVDAGVGGKSAVDLRIGKKLLKNFAGTFYPAHKVILSSHWLSSLPIRERRSGLGEVLKALYLAGEKPALASMKNFLQGQAPDRKLTIQIAKAIRYKARIVQKDPLDTKRIRECLNYGHTIGHALESLAAGKLTHGEAIAFGMALETLFLEYKLARAPKFSQQISSDLQELGFSFPKSLRKIKRGAYLSFLKGDKKMAGGKLAMSIVLQSGQIRKIVCSPLELAIFLENVWL